MSQMRKRSSKELPVERDARACAARRRARRAGDGVGARVTHRSAAGDVDAGVVLLDPVTRAPADVDQRLGGDALVEDLLGARLRDVHERRERRAARRRRTCARTARRSRWKVRAVVQVTPSAAICSPAPTDGPDVEHVALLADRLASRRGRARGGASSTTDGTPQRASSSAVVCPTGPAPTTSTGSCGQLVMSCSCVPDLAVALGRPDHRPLDAGQLVPQPRHVERQAVLEDRPAPVLLGAGRRGGVERVLEGAAARLHGADLAEHDVAGSGGSARSPRRPSSRPRRDRAAPADQRLGAERARRGRGWRRPSRGGTRRRCRARPAASTRSPAKRIFCRGSQADDVALGVPAAAVLQHQVAAVAAEVDGEPVGERERGPGEAGHGVGLLGQPRHAAELATPSPACPRSAISSRVFSCATITSASNALAPSTRTAW